MLSDYKSNIYCGEFEIEGKNRQKRSIISTAQGKLMWKILCVSACPFHSSVSIYLEN